MSATFYTWGQLKKFAEANGVTDNSLVMGLHPDPEDWKIEGMFDPQTISMKDADYIMLDF